uniref:Uncharacterized protein n=1 Tax=Trichogramma kaykai TaxID=54128 RepID=A0ABD2WMQ6_9HYME
MDARRSLWAQRELRGYIFLSSSVKSRRALPRERAILARRSETNEHTRPTELHLYTNLITWKLRYVE